jgi:lipopolysaccharide/colanic/teichoic acid biosynthesis glycosyltransferase
VRSSTLQINRESRNYPDDLPRNYPINELPRIIEKSAREAGVPRENRFTSAVRRLTEILLASLAILVTSPVMLVVAIVIRRDSPGSAIFKHVRVGRNGRPFVFYKFRTHYKDTRDTYPELWRYDYTPEELEDLQVKRTDDPRVTKVGRWLRKSTLDELPNFWNLFKGDIAIVGPRPDVPEMLPNYSLEQMMKFSVKPGITGLAQVCGRGKLKFQDQNGYDVEYAHKRSVLLDCKIVFQTIKLIIIRDATF